MNIFKKSLIGAALAVGLAASAQASMITVGGVSWDPDSAIDFSSVSANIHQDINNSTGELTGYGVITSLNGLAASVFCPSCELTFQFGGLTATGPASIPTASLQSFSYSGGWFKVYVDNTPDIANPLLFGSINNTNTGVDAGTQLWLSLIGHTDIFGNSFLGTTQRTTMTGSGQLDVVGGLAAGNFDTNTVSDDDQGTFMGADLSFSTSFTRLLGAPNKYLSADGSGNFNGNTIPEPASMALMGLGLLGIGAIRRRKALK